MDKKKNHPHPGDAEYTDQEAIAAAPAGEQAAASASGTDERIKQLEETLAAKEAEAAANWDKFVRERADLENYRKRVQKEKEELLKYGNESLILEILPILDNMERALAHACEESQGGVVEGVRLTHDMLLATLKKFGVVPLEVARGAAFDPGSASFPWRLPGGPCSIRLCTMPCTRWRATSFPPTRSRRCFRWDTC